MNKKIILLLIINILFITNIDLFAQKKDSISKYFFRASISHGFIAPHHNEFKYFIKNHIKSFELSINKQTNGAKEWEQIARYPSLGIGYYYAHLGNNQILGEVHALYSNISMSILNKKYFGLNYSFSTGIAYLTKKYDFETNYTNIAISSNLNVYLSLGISAKYKFPKKVEITNSIKITHYSNGASNMPNKGLNIVTYQLGFNYMLKQRAKIINNEIAKKKKLFEYSIFYAIGRRVREIGTKKYLTSTLSANVERVFSHKGKYGLGLDLFYDGSKKIELFKNYNDNPKKSEYLYSGVHLSYDIIFGKMSFTFQTGYYFYNKALFYQDYYQRYGLRYKFTKHLMANLLLKTYFAKADFIEYGIAFYW